MKRSKAIAGFHRMGWRTAARRLGRAHLRNDWRGRGFNAEPSNPHHLWRGDLAKRRTAPLGCKAAPKQATPISPRSRGDFIGAASQPSGDKSPRHRATMSKEVFGWTCRSTYPEQPETPASHHGHRKTPHCGCPNGKTPALRPSRCHGCVAPCSCPSARCCRRLAHRCSFR